MGREKGKRLSRSHEQLEYGIYSVALHDAERLSGITTRSEVQVDSEI